MCNFVGYAYVAFYKCNWKKISKARLAKLEGNRVGRKREKRKRVVTILAVSLAVASVFNCITSFKK